MAKARAHWTATLSWLREDPLRALMILLVVVAAAPRLWAMWFDQGVFWPDEIYQTIEQGHRLAFGYGFTPWEFDKGVRSWLFPGVLGALLKVASLLGASTGEALVKTAKTFMVLLALWAVVGSMQLGKRLGGAYGALFAGVFTALFPASNVYAARCMGEMASAPLLVAATVLILDGGKKRVLWAGALAGTAIHIRYQTGLLTVAFLLTLLFSRRFKDSLWYALSAGAFGLAGGLLDWFTWGKPFHAFIEYYKFNVIEGKSAGWGVAGPTYYSNCLWNSTGGIAIVVLGLGFLLSFARLRLIPLAVIAYVAGHVMIPHKEYRFLMPVIPLTLALSGGGLGYLLERLVNEPRARIMAWVATGTAVAMGVLLVHKLLTIHFIDMGWGHNSPVGDRAPWHQDEGPNLAFWEAGKDPELCGIMLVGVPLIATGGYSYLHKNVPILTNMGFTAHSNFLAAPILTSPPAGYRLVKSFRSAEFALFKRPGTCAPPPAGYSTHFP